jgi:predicted RNase H-like HicB family nuclease
MSEIDQVWSQENKERLLQFLYLFGVPESAMTECGSHILTEISRWIGNKNVKHLTHDYVVTLRRLQPEEGGGYGAAIPQLGTGAFCSCGETIEEALNSLQDLYVWLEEDFKTDETFKFTFPDAMDEDCIQFVPQVKMSPEEVNEKFRGYLATAHKKNLTDDKGSD